MSQQAVDPDDIPRRVYKAIVDRHADSQDEKVQTVVGTQSLRTVLERLSANNEEMPRILRVTGSRTSKTDDMSLPVTGTLRHYLDYGMNQSITARLSYDYLDHRVEFPREEIVDWLNASGDHTPDVALDSLAIEVEDTQLYDHLLAVLTDAVDLIDRKEFDQPLVAEFESYSTRGEPAFIERMVRQHHDDRYWTSGSETTPAGDRGLGWSPRTLDLIGIWSKKAWTGNTQAVVHTYAGDNLWIDDIEELAFNPAGGNVKVYGAVNSKLVGNRIRGLFGNSITDFKTWKWDTTEGWIRSDT